MRNLSRKGENFMKHNTIRALLTVSSCLGVAGTAYMAVRDTVKNQKLPEFDGEKDILMHFKRKICDYIPTMIVGGATIGCIVTNHIITAKEVKALATLSAGATALLEKYKTAIEEEFGKEGAEQIVRNVANKRFAEISGVVGTDLLTEDGSELFYMEFNDTFFRSSKSKVLNAMYIFNREFAADGKVPVDRLCDLLEIEPNIHFYDEDYGFSFQMLDGDPKFIDFDIVDAATDKGEPFKILYFGREAGIYSVDADTYVELD